jgi:hypothetical protein
MAIPSFTSTVVARAAAGLYGLQLGYATMNSVMAEANVPGSGGINALIDAVYARDYGNATTTSVAQRVVANLGITGAGVPDAEAYVKDLLDATPAANRGSAVAEAIGLFSTLDTHPVYGAAASAFNGRIAAAVAYSQTPGTFDRDINQGATLGLTLGVDFLTGTPTSDTIVARIFDNSNSLQSGDTVNGGAGSDRLEADMGTSANFAVTPETTNVETIAIRAQAHPNDSGDNNVAGPQRVKIDAERIVGAQRFESNNSRADVVIEDVRILPSQITKDITVAFVESDPGHVDYALYFDQYSLRNQVSNTSSINLQIMDTVAAAAGLAPLLNSNYGAFTFTVTIGGASRVVTLASDAIQNAQTYAEMAAAFQAALNAEFGPGVASATVGDNFTVVDPASRIAVTGQNIVLTTNTAATFSTPAGSGWLASGTAPPLSNFYTNYFTGSTASASLVTSTVILDDVGRGSTGGDLVIGGLSVGSTSSSLGVQRFEIEVQDNSKLESISSTNNTLREVTIKNGLTTSSSHAYVPTVKDAGNLAVNGATTTNGGNVTTGVVVDPATSGVMPGGSASRYGFQDVRLIDATEMRGKFEFSAEVTVASLAKYLNLKDAAPAQPAADNVAFTYNGGTNDDKMFVQIDGAVAGSRSTLMVGREDFTFTANGGAGNDTIEMRMVSATGTPGGLQAWYTNQKLNKNVFVNGGDGNDTIRTPGAGDKIITGGAGDDTVYADNSGVQAVSAVANSQLSLLAAAYRSDEIAEQANALAVRATADSTSATLTQRISLALNDLAVAITGSTAVPTTDAAVTAATTAAVDAGAITAAQKTAIDTAAATGVAGNPTAAEIAAALAIVNPLLATARTDAAAAISADARAGTTPQGLIPALLAALTIGATDAAVNAATLAAVGAGGLTAAQQAQIDAIAGLNVANATIAEVNAMVRIAEAALTNSTPDVAYLTATADALVDATTVVNNATAVLTNLTALQTAIAVGTTDAAVATAAANAVLNGSITEATRAAIVAAAASVAAGAVDAVELANVALVLQPVLAAANAALTAANTARTAAATANNVAIEAVIAGGAAAITAESALETTAAALLPFTTANNTAQAVVTNLNALKTAIQVGTIDPNVQFATAAAVANLSISPAQKAAIDAAAASVAAGAVDAAEKNAVDVLIDSILVPATAAAAVTANNLAAATVVSNLQATEAANIAAALLAGGEVLTNAPGKAVFVVNTANQLAVGSGYALVGNDERNLADLKSDVNDTYNFYAARLTVTFKDITATVDVPSTGFRTSDLQINQAIKDAINNNAVLNKLIVATDGPANTLVITSLIDGVMSNANLSFALTLPALAGIVDVAGAAAVYGTASTAEAVLAAMQAAQTAFNTKADYVDQLAESGTAGGNTELTGAASVTTSDNTITPGTGNDVTVLGTTVGLDALQSSNDRVVFGTAFGNDTVVHFRAGSAATGGDVLVLSALGGTTLGTAFNVNNSINVANETLANDTAAEVAALFTDSATAQTHVYIAVDTVTNIGKVYSVTDAAGTAAGNVTATLQGTIDLADTLWSTLTIDNFA